MNFLKNKLSKGNIYILQADYSKIIWDIPTYCKKFRNRGSIESCVIREGRSTHYYSLTSNGMSAMLPALLLIVSIYDLSLSFLQAFCYFFNKIGDINMPGNAVFPLSTQLSVDKLYKSCILFLYDIPGILL